MPYKVNHPYARCRQIGLDFNVGSDWKRCLDRQLVIYGVLFEISKFARQVNKADFFITEILENNFNICFHDEHH